MRIAVITLCALTAASSAAAQSARVLLRTDLGEIEIEVDSAHAPVTATNFLRYVDGGFYEGGRFYRTVRADNQPNDSIRIAVIQAGINSAKSREQFPRIALERTSVTGLKHVDGTLSMARGGPDTATSSFFICIGDNHSLDFGGMRNPRWPGLCRVRTCGARHGCGAEDSGRRGQRQNLTTPVLIQEARRLPAPVRSQE